MSDLFAARSQMAISLAFHIVFAAIGIGMPLLMVLSEAVWLRTRDAVWLEITKAWARGVAVFFAVGAVSGTVLSFELGLLWPRFMDYAGAIIGMPFSLEGFAFFTEAIFLGIYLYGWDRVSPRAHWWAGVAVAVSGAASALFVLAVNGWMNAPLGFEHTPGGPVSTLAEALRRVERHGRAGGGSLLTQLPRSFKRIPFDDLPPLPAPAAKPPPTGPMAPLPGPADARPLFRHPDAPVSLAEIDTGNRRAPVIGIFPFRFVDFLLRHSVS